MYNPTDAEVAQAIADAHAMSLLSDNVQASLRQQLKTSHPEWSLSKKRLQQLDGHKAATAANNTSSAIVESWNGIVIHPDIYGDDPTHSLSHLQNHLDLCEVTFQENGDVEDDCLEDLLNAKNGTRIASFYSRHDICGWYYAAYACTDDSTAPVNTIAAEMLRRTIRGRILVILDGPKEGKWMENTVINVEELARTLWWYRQSGSDVAEVFGERELRRFVSTLHD